MIEDVLATIQAGRTARYHHTFIKTRAGFRHGRRSQIKIDVVGDEKIEMAIPVVVDECAACAPATLLPSDSGLLAHVGKSSIAVVVIENVLAVVSYEQIFEAIVVIISNANALPPAAMAQSSFCGHVGECAVAIVLEQMRRGFVSRGKAFQSRAIHQKNVEPAVVVVVVEGHSAAGGLQQIFVLMFSAKNGFHVQTGFAADIYKADA